jgi:hypothetical protein
MFSFILFYFFIFYTSWLCPPFIYFLVLVKKSLTYILKCMKNHFNYMKYLKYMYMFGKYYCVHFICMNIYIEISRQFS